MIYDLPTSVELGGVEYPIRSDYRQILDVILSLQDPELDREGQLYSALVVFYEDFWSVPKEYQEDALKACFWFISGGQEGSDKKSPRILDWEQDFRLIVAPVNRVCGHEMRAVPYLHWWTFLACYMEIGDCTFAQVVNIRSKLARGKKMDKSERQWYQQNRELVDFKRKYTETDNDFLRDWGGA